MKYIKDEDITKLFPARPKECHKGNFGYVALIGGSLEYSGAIRLAGLANTAMRSGAGVASIAAPRSICPIIANSILEATLLPLSETDGRILFSEDDFEPICRRYDCIAFGMGIGNSDETRRAIDYLLRNYDRTLIVDADGLNAMADLDKTVIRNSRAQLILTPHLKEFSRLSRLCDSDVFARKTSAPSEALDSVLPGPVNNCSLSIDEIKADPISAAAALADELNAIVLLKGSTTIVTEPIRPSLNTDGSTPVPETHPISPARQVLQGLRESEQSPRRIFMTDRGCPGMATAGSGDVLSGILSAICVNADDLTLAAAAGAYINGAAGELAQSRHSDVTMTSADTATCVAETIESIISRQRREPRIQNARLLQN